MDTPLVSIQGLFESKHDWQFGLGKRLKVPATEFLEPAHIDVNKVLLTFWAHCQQSPNLRLRSFSNFKGLFFFFSFSFFGSKDGE